MKRGGLLVSRSSLGRGCEQGAVDRIAGRRPAVFSSRRCRRRAATAVCDAPGLSGRAGSDVRVSCVFTLGLILTVTLLVLVSCSSRPTSAAFRAEEKAAIQAYCAGTAEQAERALLKCDDCLHRCQKAQVGGILYAEAAFRIHGRLYLIETDLGNQKAADQHLREALKCAKSGVAFWAHQTRAPRDDYDFIAVAVDHGVQPNWKLEHAWHAQH